MDIDLLCTKTGETGLIASENLVKKATGVVFNGATGLLTIEYSDMDYLELNIPLDRKYNKVLDYCFFMHIGAFKNGHIAQAYQVPLMIDGDPYRAEIIKAPPPPKNPVLTFENFIKGCVTGQPVHREDLGNEESMGCVLGDAVPAALEFAPHLARRRNFEAVPTLGPTHVPGLGLGGSGGGGGRTNYGYDGDPEDSD